MSDNLKTILVLIGLIAILAVAELATECLYVFSFPNIYHTKPTAFKKTLPLMSLNFLFYDIIGNYEGGIKYFNKQIAKNNNKANTYVYKALIETNHYHYQAAIQDYTNAIKIDPKYFYCYQMRAIAREKAGDYEKARGYKKKALAFYQDSLKDWNVFLNVDPEDEEAQELYNRVVGKESALNPMSKKVAKKAFVPKKPEAAKAQNTELDDWEGPYMSALQKKIKGSWNPKTMKKSRRTVLLFTVNKKGEVSNIRVVNSSGDKKADAEAIEAVKKSSPFPPLPNEYKEKNIDINFTFDYNVWFDKFRKKKKI